MNPKLRHRSSIPLRRLHVQLPEARRTCRRSDEHLQNESRAMMHLHTKRADLMLSLGGDAVVISMNR
jgi:hypothetical protein